MPHLQRVSCGPGRTVRNESLRLALHFRDHQLNVLVTKYSGKSGILPFFSVFFSWRRSSFLLNGPERADEDSIDIARSLTWGTFPLAPWYTKASLQPLEMKQRPLCLLYKNYTKRVVGEGDSHMLIHRLEFMTSISFFLSLSHSKSLSPTRVSQGTCKLWKVYVWKMLWISVWEAVLTSTVTAKDGVPWNKYHSLLTEAVYLDKEKAMSWYL